MALRKFDRLAAHNFKSSNHGGGHGGSHGGHGGSDGGHHTTGTGGSSGHIASTVIIAGNGTVSSHDSQNGQQTNDPVDENVQEAALPTIPAVCAPGHRPAGDF